MDKLIEKLLNIRFALACLFFGFIFIALGSTGGFTVGCYTILPINSIIGKVIFILIGLISILFACILETIKNSNYKKSNIHKSTEIVKIKKTRIIDENKANIIAAMLEAGARAIIYPRSDEKVKIRAFCHRIDKKKKVLIPVCLWSPSHVEDYDAHIPIEGERSKPFIIAAAYNQKTIIAEDIPTDAWKAYPIELQDKIQRDLKCVLAAPICDFIPGGREIIGTISFDSSSHSLRGIRFNKELAKDVIEVFAKAVFLVIMNSGE